MGTTSYAPTAVPVSKRGTSRRILTLGRPWLSSEHMLRHSDEPSRPDTIHPESVARARAGQVNDDDLTGLADIFQILASPSRLRIVEALAAAELCVCDLSEVVDLSQSAVSHHLRPLRQLRLVRVRREGRRAYYRLDDEHVTTLFKTGMEHVRE